MALRVAREELPDEVLALRGGQVQPEYGHLGLVLVPCLIDAGSLETVFPESCGEAGMAATELDGLPASAVPPRDAASEEDAARWRLRGLFEQRRLP